MKRRKFILATSGVAGGAFLPPARAALPCPPPQISVVGGGTATTACTSTASGKSTLAMLAASMAPGTWAKLTPANDPNPVLGVGQTSGTMLHYCNQMPWNPRSKCIEIVGKDAGAVPWRHVRYVEATNTFEVVESNTSAISGAGHGYDHTTVNPYNGDLYYHPCDIGGGASIRAKVKPFGGGSFSTTTASVSTSYLQIAIGTCWWSGAFTGGAGFGAQGGLIVFNSGYASSPGQATDGQILGYSPTTNKWVFNAQGMAPNSFGAGYTYHSICEYSEVKNVAVYGGGDEIPRKVYRLNSDGTKTALPDVPAGKAVGIQKGLLCADPVTGNFLLLSAGQLWELNPSGSGTWTQMTGTRVPPSGVGIPGPTNPQAVICSSIAEYGVVAFITQPTQSGNTFYLYKHA